MDLLFDVHEGAKSRKAVVTGNLVLDTNLRLGPLLTCKQTRAAYSRYQVARALKNLRIDHIRNHD